MILMAMLVVLVPVGVVMAGSENMSDIFYEEVYLAAKKLGVTQALAGDIARMADDGIKRRCGGGRVYVPIDKVEQRDQSLFSDHLNGLKINELMKKYNLSRPAVYQRLKKMQG